MLFEGVRIQDERLGQDGGTDLPNNIAHGSIAGLLLKGPAFFRFGSASMPRDELFLNRIGVFEQELASNIFQIQVHVVSWLIVRQHFSLPIENAPSRCWHSDSSERLVFLTIFVLLAGDDLQMPHSGQQDEHSSQKDRGQASEPEIACLHLVEY